MDSSPDKHPLNLNAAEFDYETYVSNLLQKKNLDELVAIEEDMVQNVRRLDSEMQQLVYENYSKFLTATHTVRTLQSQFCAMGDRMTGLSDKMTKIADLTTSLSGVFSRHRENVRKLTDASKTVKGLQNIVKLPQRLQVYIDQKDYKKAIRSYLAVRPRLVGYKDIPSMTAIYQDCVELIAQIEEKLRTRLTSRLISSEELVDAIVLLRDLGTPATELESTMLTTWNDQISSELNSVETHEFADILEFAENGCCNFLTTLSIAANLYPQLFRGDQNQQFVDLIESHLEKFEKVVHQRFKAEGSCRDNAIYIRALDRVFRKLAACDRLISWRDYSVMNNNIIVSAASHQVQLGRETIVATVKTTFFDAIEEAENSFTTNIDIPQLVHKLEQSYLVTAKTTLANLLLFTASDITFSAIDPEHFFLAFSRNVHEQIVVGALLELSAFAKESIENEASGFSKSASLGYLILAVFFNLAQKKHINYVMDLCQEQFKLTERLMELTLPSTLADDLESTAKELLKTYVDIKGAEMSKLGEIAVNSVSWLECPPPKLVRTEVIDIVKHVSQIAVETTIFLVEFPQKGRSPDPGRTSTPRHVPSSSNFETGSLSSALEKMWNDKVDYDSVIDFKQESVLAAVIKIGLKSLVEHSRVHVYSRNGLQQMQVDCLFLRGKLWAHVSDEHVLNTLIDDIVSSVVIQCQQPVLLDPKVAKEICELSDKQME